MGFDLCTRLPKASKTRWSSTVVVPVAALYSARSHAVPSLSGSGQTTVPCLRRAVYLLVRQELVHRRAPKLAVVNASVPVPVWLKAKTISSPS